MLSPLGQVRQISVGNKKAKSHWQYHWYCAMYVLFDMIRKANVYPHDPFTGKGHHLYLSLILRTYDLSAVADPGKGPGGPSPLIFRPKWGPKGRKNQGLDAPPPPPLIRRSGSATVSSASPTLILENLVITWLYTVLRTTGTPIQCNLINRYGNPNATEENRMSARTFGDKNNNNKVASFDVIFGVYTHEDTRERARETNFVGRKT